MYFLKLLSLKDDFSSRQAIFPWGRENITCSVMPPAAWHWET